MRILCITQEFQHPLVRGSTRSYHLLKQLSLRHQITLLTIARTSITPSILDEMATYLEEVQVFDAIPILDPRGRRETDRASTCMQRMKRTLINYYEMKNFRRERTLKEREAARKLKQAFLKLVSSESYDLVLFKGTSIFPLIEDWNDLPIVIDFGDANSERLRSSLRYTNLLEWPWLLRYYRSVKQVEKKLLKKTPYIAFISCRDRNALIGECNDAAIVPIGVDLNFWTRRYTCPPSNTIIFTGVMDYRPNEDAALYLINNIVPLVRRSISDIKVLIVGRNPSAALAETAEQDRDIIVTGFVEDMRPYLERATVFVAPLRFASGTQNKVLEALAMQVPVVCTSIVAKGFHFDDFRDPPVYVADGTEQLANAIIELLRDEEKRSRLATQGRQFAHERFNWSRSAQTMENLCNRAVKNAHFG